MKLSDIEILVKQILQELPDTRSSNKLLYLEFCEKCGLKFTPEQKSMFLKIADFETLSRTARHIKSNNPLLRPSNHQQNLLLSEEIRTYYKK